MSSGALIGFVTTWIMCSAVSVILGYGVDMIVHIANTSSNSSLGMLTLISQIHLIYVAGPLFFFILLGFNYWTTTNSEYNQEV